MTASLTDGYSQVSPLEQQQPMHVQLPITLPPASHITHVMRDPAAVICQGQPQDGAPPNVPPPEYKGGMAKLVEQRFCKKENNDYEKTDI